MNETRKLQKTPTPGRADRRMAAVITEYIHELAVPARRAPGLRTVDQAKAS